jgi:hypothetical protein
MPALPVVLAEGTCHVYDLARRSVPRSSEMQPRPRRQATIPGVATVQYESKENAGRKFWTARSGRHAIRIDANRPGVYRWLITLEGRSVRKGIAPGRDEAAAAVSDALDELTGQRS